MSASIALQITDTIARLQKELRCGICCSTFKDPILSTCHHIFCRTCINTCFERKRKVECPICRTVLDKRSCRDSYQITMAVQNYLKLSTAFKQDIENINTFRTLPPEKAFMESQMPLDVTIIPENDGKRCAPDFAIPLLPVRRKRTSRPVPSAEPSTSGDPAPEPPEIPVFTAPISSSKAKKAAPFKEQQTKIDAEIMTDPCRILPSELQNVDIQEHINAVCQNGEDEIDALFYLIPSMREFLQKNATLLMNKLDIPITSPERRKSDRRVSFASSQNLEAHRYPTQSVPLEDAPEPPKPTLTATMADDDDEVVEDSEGEAQEDTQEMNQENLADLSNVTQSTTLDADRTDKAIQSEADRLDEELARPAKYIVCSRIHNDEDEVELLSDFYHKFLSNSCRFSEDVNEHTTHLVMMNSEGRNIPQKSIAYLQAIARKCVVVGRDWFVECLKTGCLCEESDYTITSCSSSITADIVPKSGAEIGWLRARSDAGGKLFAGFRFMILRRFTMSPYFDYKHLIELVQLCGGEILSNYENQSPVNLYMIFSKHSKSIAESRNMENLYKCQVVTTEWVLDCISEYSILPTDAYKAIDSIEDD
ncbi:CRE-BRC-1 protein [Caenorhabditis remanei]|uniref:RING-type E3 ubiquitin transferase BRCA1 n=1 Tax=Caenorhabditis remanei TaxID=31234 RepID=E3M8H3_CAERE|nr:CRE-BRC-1 protein [Caenorhabditis remanei]